MGLLTAAVLLLSAPEIGQALHKLAAAAPARTAAAERPLIVLPRPAPPFAGKADNPADYARAVDCLAQAIYYEAGFEPVAGQRAVAQVVLNRVRDRNFPHTVCGVVYQGAGRKTGCQFSFVCDGSLVRRPPKPPAWDKARTLAAQALNGYVVKAVGAATHYHTDYVQPWWGDTVVKVAQIGAHTFYTWPGKAGTPAALQDARYAGDEVSVWERIRGHPRPSRHGRSHRA